jgi:hypothetical protein
VYIRITEFLYFVSPGVSTVDINFWNLSWLSLQLRQDYFLFRSSFLKLRLLNWDLARSRFSSRLSRYIEAVEIFEICWDFSRFIKISQHYRDFLRYFWIKNLDKLRNLNQEIWWNWLTLDQDRDKLSRFAKNVMCQQISWSRLRLLRLEGGVETKSRFLHLNWDYSIIKTSFLKLSRFSQLLRPTLCQCWDWESRSRQIETPRLIFFTLSKVFVCHFSVDWKIFHFGQLIKSFIFSRSKYLIF